MYESEKEQTLLDIQYQVKTLSKKIDSMGKSFSKRQESWQSLADAILKIQIKQSETFDLAAKSVESLFILLSETNFAIVNIMERIVKIEEKMCGKSEQTIN